MCMRSPVCVCVYTGAPAVSTYDIIGDDGYGKTITAGQAQVFVTYKQRLYITLKFKCRYAAVSYKQHDAEA